MGKTIVNMAIGASEVIVHLKGRNVGNRQMANMANDMVQQEFLKIYGEEANIVKYCTRKILARVRQPPPHTGNDKI